MSDATKGARAPTRRKLLLGAVGTLAATMAGIGAFRDLAIAKGLHTLTWAGMAFQTPVALTIAGPDREALDSAMDAAFASLRAVENASSVYRQNSDLSQLNRVGRLEAPHPHLVTLVSYALQLAAATDGRYDPTVQPLWDAWAAQAARGTRPSDEMLRMTLQRVDWRGVSIEADTIAFDRPGMRMTLNSINQGYAADVVMATLAAHGITDAFIDTGEFGARGHNAEGRDWRLGVAAPRAPGQLAFTYDPFQRFAATSGDYKTFFSPDFRDHHIFDPRTGRSPPDWSSITVDAPSGLVADGLSTALFVLDQSGCRRLLLAHPDCNARFFGKDGAEVRVESQA